MPVAHDQPNKMYLLLLFLVGFINCQQAPRGKYLGDFVNHYHGVAGQLWALDDKTLEIRGFSYDHGGNPPAVEIVAVKKGIKKIKNGVSLNVKRVLENGEEEELGTKLGFPFVNEKLRVVLPFSVNSLKLLSVYCREFAVSFGDVTLP